MKGPLPWPSRKRTSWVIDLPLALPVLRTSIDTLDGVISLVRRLVLPVPGSTCPKSLPLPSCIADIGPNSLPITLIIRLRNIGPERQLPVFSPTVPIVLDIDVHLATTIKGTLTPLPTTYLRRRTLLFRGRCILERTKLKGLPCSNPWVKGLLTVAVIVHFLCLS